MNYCLYVELSNKVALIINHYKHNVINGIEAKTTTDPVCTSYRKNS